MRNLVVSKPEHHNLRRKTLIRTKFEFSRKKEHSLIADTKLNKPLFFKLIRMESILKLHSFCHTLMHIVLTEENRAVRSLFDTRVCLNYFLSYGSK